MLKQIDARFGMGEPAVSQAWRRFVLRIENDCELRKLIEKIEGKLKMPWMET